ncbi:TraD, partial [Vibrio parahaemolyticus]|nr:TraD [Vibrio parahaemolyticus]
MDYDPLGYEMPWRPNFEGRAALGWAAASGVALTVNQMAESMPPEPFYWMTGICGVMAMS